CGEAFGDRREHPAVNRAGPIAQAIVDRHLAQDQLRRDLTQHKSVVRLEAFGGVCHSVGAFSTLRSPMASLDSLPPDQRAVLQMVLQRGRSYDDIAEMLSIDRASVRRRALEAFDELG